MEQFAVVFELESGAMATREKGGRIAWTCDRETAERNLILVLLISGRVGYQRPHYRLFGSERVEGVTDMDRVVNHTFVPKRKWSRAKHHTVASPIKR